MNKLIITAFYILFLVGIAGHYFEFSRPLMTAVTPLVLTLTYLLFIWGIRNSLNRKFAAGIISIFLITFLLEVLGVKYGIIFGDYAYGEVLGPKLFGVPLVIGINWVLIILGVTSISERLIDNTAFIVLASGILAVFFDMILEVVAVELTYWSWADNNIPFSNYLAWFLITAASAFILRTLKIKIESAVPVHYFLAQYLFFSSLYFLIA